MLSLMDRYFIKKPEFRRFVTKLVAGNSEKKVRLLGMLYLVHTLREHGDGDTFLDIGANIGIFAGGIASLRGLYPNLNVYAFEPNPDTAARLRANVEALGVMVFDLALSDRNGILDFVDGPMSNVFSTIDNSSSYSIASERSACECRRLEDLPIEGDSLVMKIDVEGHECQVLQGGVAHFQGKKVRAVYLDGFKDDRVSHFLKNYRFRLLDGETLAPATDQTRRLLAINEQAR